MSITQQLHGQLEIMF